MRRKFRPGVGDTCILATHYQAMDRARKRAQFRGRRQVLTIQNDLTAYISQENRYRYGWQFWVIQDREEEA